jgi:hypothetical protein
MAAYRDVPELHERIAMAVNESGAKGEVNR